MNPNLSMASLEESDLEDIDFDFFKDFTLPHIGKGALPGARRPLHAGRGGSHGGPLPEGGCFRGRASPRRGEGVRKR